MTHQVAPGSSRAFAPPVAELSNRRALFVYEIDLGVQRRSQPEDLDRGQPDQPGQDTIAVPCSSPPWRDASLALEVVLSLGTTGVARTACVTVIPAILLAVRRPLCHIPQVICTCSPVPRLCPFVRGRASDCSAIAID